MNKKQGPFDHLLPQTANKEIHESQESISLKPKTKKTKRRKSHGMNQRLRWWLSYRKDKKVPIDPEVHWIGQR